MSLSIYIYCSPWGTYTTRRISALYPGLTAVDWEKKGPSFVPRSLRMERDDKFGGTGGNLIDSGSGEFTRSPNFQRLITGVT